MAAIEYAGWLRRAAAFASDAALVWTGVVLVAVAVAAVAYDASTYVYNAGLLLLPGYYTVGHGGRRGRTVGKATVGIAVRDERTFGPLGHGRAFARRLVTWPFWMLLVVPGVLDALSPLGNERRRAWHDRIAGSIVVRV